MDLIIAMTLSSFLFIHSMNGPINFPPPITYWPLYRAFQVKCGSPVLPVRLMPMVSVCLNSIPSFSQDDLLRTAFRVSVGWVVVVMLVGLSWVGG